jgi:4,5:9,10-diseco-3-hydroxy-5,9,17-trioxoandrosta-1(10),2-diene-4-oate hydrolase
VGAVQRAGFRASLLFASPERVPLEWYGEQYRLAQRPSFLTQTLASLRAHVGFRGQRIVLLDELRRLTMPTLLVWGEQDWIFPVRHARDAVTRLQDGRLALIPESGHLPHVEQAEKCAAVLARFLGEHTTSTG